MSVASLYAHPIAAVGFLVLYGLLYSALFLGVNPRIRYVHRNFGTGALIGAAVFLGIVGGALAFG